MNNNTVYNCTFIKCTPVEKPDNIIGVRNGLTSLPRIGDHINICEWPDMTVTNIVIDYNGFCNSIEITADNFHLSVLIYCE